MLSPRSLAPPFYSPGNSGPGKLRSFSGTREQAGGRQQAGGRRFHARGLVERTGQGQLQSLQPANPRVPAQKEPS